MILSGAIVNAGAVLIGGIVGSLLKNGISERLNKTLTQGLGLCVLYVGISGSLKGENIIIAILSVVIGCFIGEKMDLDNKFEKFGTKLMSRISKQEDSAHFAEGFINCTLFVCVGAMAIVGSLQSGLAGNHEVLYSKSLIDAAAVLVMAAAFGVSTCFAALPVLLYESILTLSARAISPYLSDSMMNEMTCVGSLLIIAISLNMLKLTDIKIANFLPAPFLPIFIMLVLQLLPF